MRRHVTLIEMLVAMTLAAALFGLLFGAYYRTSRAKAVVGEEAWPLMERYALHQRLSQLLPQASGGEHPLLLSDGRSVTFLYNNGIDDDPLFSAEVLGHLYLQDDYLLLATWPSPERWDLPTRPHRLEVLAEGCAALSFSFYEPPQQDPAAVQPPSVEFGQERLTPHPGWSSRWEKAYHQLPALVSVLATFPEGEPFVHTYPVPEADKPVRYYWQGGST